MDTATQSDTGQIDASISHVPKVRISRWIWKPRYARLWWSGAALYWTGFALSFSVPLLEGFYSTALAGCLNVAFYPPVILIILGMGFVRAKIRRGDWIVTPGDPEIHKRSRSVSGSLDPYTDPLEPRSGSLYIGSPENLAQLFGRKWP